MGLSLRENTFLLIGKRSLTEFECVIVFFNVQSSLMKGSNDDSFSSCGRSDGSDIGSGVSSLVSVALWQTCSCLSLSPVHDF